ncbi:MAG: ABC transporter permease [endosymbiont of Galathealinum brachiosum]|uniref:ABC transporter permease n=1 Tax=endosymbiont of Galathealinum brachiosum TaxID=2200906 RepID=A0A370DD16_9GAMM|nr:MAG: ABC transporter permease [endosymbiont of Galathealinum brachiosum]
MKWSRFISVLRARDREFLRDRSALAWNVIFPLLIIFGFAFAFTGDQLTQYKVGVVNQTDDAQLDFYRSEYIQFIPIVVADKNSAIDKVKRHQLDMLLDAKERRYWVNDSSPSGYMIEKVLSGSGGAGYQKQLVQGKQIRYVDWLIPGVLGMNMMFSALFGVGYVVVRYRKNGVLKRLKATPLSALEFLSAQVVSRLWLIMVITTAVFIGCDLLIGFAMHGSYVNLFIVYVLGAFSMISMGLIVAARVKSEEMAGGLLNMLSWPMMFLSGVWFSLEGLHPWVQKMALIFPLTHITHAARGIMLDGVGLLAILPNLVSLLVMSVIFLLLGVLLFRWE